MPTEPAGHGDSGPGDFWSYWFPLGKLEADWEQADFIFFDEGRIHVHTIRMRRFSKEESDAFASESRK